MKPNFNERETLKAKIQSLNAVTKRYFKFNLVALVFSAVICGLFVSRESTTLSAMAGTLLFFSAVYIFFMTLVITLGSMYDQERNVIAGVIPLVMTLIGLILAFWLYDEYLSDQLGFWSEIIAWFALTIPPLVSFVLCRALSIAAGKLYFINLFQIIITGLLAWLEFIWFI